MRGEKKIKGIEKEKKNEGEGRKKEKNQGESRIE